MANGMNSSHVVHTPVHRPPETGSVERRKPPRPDWLLVLMGALLLLTLLIWLLLIR